MYCSFCLAILLVMACHPRIYLFAAGPASVGQHDPIPVHWKVRGTATLLIHDINYPGSGATTLSTIQLRITRQGVINSYTLGPVDTLQLPLTSQADSLVITKQASANQAEQANQADQPADDRLRYLMLVASSRGKDSIRVIQVAIRPDSASDEIGFRDSVRNDTLIAAGVNNPVRWGNDFEILTVSYSGSRELLVMHAGVTRVLHPGDPPNTDFHSTPVQGYWSLRSPLTAAEKANLRLTPPALKINITIIHHRDVTTKY
jgi:hypothetical protein